MKSNRLLSLCLCAALLTAMTACKPKAQAPPVSSGWAGQSEPLPPNMEPEPQEPPPAAAPELEKPEEPDRNPHFEGRTFTEMDGLYYTDKLIRHNACLTEEHPVVVERFSYQQDVFNELRLDISIPALREDLPGAQAVNDVIGADWFQKLNPGEYQEELRAGFYYANCQVDYSVFQFQDVYEICIHYFNSSCGGSGSSQYTYRYCYDSQTGRLLEDEEFLALLGLTQQDVLDLFYAQLLDGALSEDEVFSYEEHVEFFYYIQEDGQIVFTTGIFT